MSPLWLPWGCGSPGTPCDCDDPYRTSRPYATNPGCSLDRHILSSPGYVRCWTSSGPSITHPRCSFAWPPSGSPLSPFDFDDPSHMSRPCATPIAFLGPTLQTLVVHVIVHVYIYIYYHLFYNRLYYMYIYICFLQPTRLQRKSPCNYFGKEACNARRGYKRGLQ